MRGEASEQRAATGGNGDAARPVKRYRRDELDKEEENPMLLSEDGDDEG